MSFQHAIQRVMSGEARGPVPALGRAALSVLEPGYRAAVAFRNRRFDRQAATVRRLPKPVISVGNLTTGGTGKTPVVRYLAEHLRERGLGVAILSRGYKSAPGTLGDEQRMLLSLLNEPADVESPSSAHPAAPLVIEADPDRYAAGLRALEREPRVDMFLLDDGFQHRRLHRDLDIVLLHAGEPFGYGHVLPRGLLREPPAGLQRAGAVIVTNANAGGPTAYASLTASVRALNPTCPIFLERHMPAGFRSSDGQVHALDALRTKAVYCFCGLAMPSGFESQIAALAGRVVGIERLPDHHDYTAHDLKRLGAAARSAAADLLVTTEKDWVKLSTLATEPDDLPIWRLDVEAEFEGRDGDRLVDLAYRTAVGATSHGS